MFSKERKKLRPILYIKKRTKKNPFAAIVVEFILHEYDKLFFIYSGCSQRS
jgi:hypothetical protein